MIETAAVATGAYGELRLEEKNIVVTARVGARGSQK
jgi:hypothetical protein